jgi:hypothetical protein
MLTIIQPGCSLPQRFPTHRLYRNVAFPPNLHHTRYGRLILTLPHGLASSRVLQRIRWSKVTYLRCG